MDGLEYHQITLIEITKRVSPETTTKQLFDFWNILKPKIDEVTSKKSASGSFCYNSMEALERGDADARAKLDAIRAEGNKLSEEVTAFTNEFIASTYLENQPVPKIDHVRIAKGKIVAVIPEDWEYHDDRRPYFYLAKVDAIVPDMEKVTGEKLEVYLDESPFFEKLEIAAIFSPDNYWHTTIETLSSDYEHNVVKFK